MAQKKAHARAIGAAEGGGDASIFRLVLALGQRQQRDFLGRWAKIRRSLGCDASSQTEVVLRNTKGSTARLI